MIKKLTKSYKDKINQCLNQALTTFVTKRMGEHKADLLERGVCDDINQVKGMLNNPSYSMTNSLQQGFQVVMYSCTHRIKLNIIPIHQITSCSIVLVNHMIII